MEYAKVNGLNREVSRIGLGTWSIGGFMWGGTDEQEALATIRAALEHGISLIDTALSFGRRQRSQPLAGWLNPCCCTLNQASLESKSNAHQSSTACVCMAKKGGVSE